MELHQELFATKGATPSSFSLSPALRPGRVCVLVCVCVSFRYLYVPIGPIVTSWTFMYLLDLQGSLGPLGTYCTFMYLLDLQGSLGPLAPYCTFRCLLDL